jgi:competence protein ComEC
MTLSLIPMIRHIALYAYSLLTHFLSLCPKLQYHYTPGFLFLFFLFFLIWKRKTWIVIGLCLLPFFQTKIDPFFHVYMLDIGQGDCTLIVEPFSRSAVMIDCGGNLYRDNVEQVVYPFLQSIQVNHLDALIVTHDDFDHNGGVDNLSKLISIDSIITNPNKTPSVSYPFFSLLPDRQEQGNDGSILSYFVYDEVGYLWTGDASIKIEQELIQSYTLNVDILKLGHHGSDTSSSYSFLDTLRPKLGLVSVGYKNRYRHPSSQVIACCHQMGIQTLETKDVGSIHLFSFRGCLFFESASGLFGIIRL